MKAAFLKEAGKFEIREIPTPHAPSDGILLAVKACGICGSDLRRWREGPENITPTPGHEVAGVVVEVGADVAGYTVGDRLAIAPDIHCGRCSYCQMGLYNMCENIKFLGITPGLPGGFAEKMVLPREVLERGVIHALPKELSFVEGALAEPLSSVLAAHQKTNTGLGDTVVIMGAGPIGVLHVLVSKIRGAEVIVSEPNSERRRLVETFHPDVIVNPSNEDLERIVKQYTQNRGADIVICANPVPATQTEAVEIVRKGGQIILFGGLPKDVALTPLNTNLIHYGEVRLQGSFSYNPIFHELALKILKRNLLPIDSIITHTFKLEELNIAFRTAASGEALKVIVIP